VPAVGDGRGGVNLEAIGNFSSPLYVTQPPGGGGALYVVEQGGRIVRVAEDGSASTFLDLSGEISSGGERGLLSLAFAPDFRRSGRLYVDYTDPDGNTRVVEFRSEDGGRAEPSSRRELLRIDQPFSNHNGGLLSFGPDQLLYIGTGDGGSADDPQRNALNPESLLGKLLRIDPEPAAGRPYGIPRDNPFAQGGGRGEIYSLGLRNPWRYSFDRETGALSIGDVGQNTREEVDLVERGAGRGANFGWSAFEADQRFNADQEASGAVEPVLAYPTSGGNCSVTGGYVVRDPRLTSLYGRYLYGDFCRGQLRSFVARPGRPARGDTELGLQVEQLSSFGEDDAGRIYVTSLSGVVYRLDPGR
jgi:glucose/arabinose dehydrogenase